MLELMPLQGPSSQREGAFLFVSVLFLLLFSMHISLCLLSSLCALAALFFLFLFFVAFSSTCCCLSLLLLDVDDVLVLNNSVLLFVGGMAVGLNTIRRLLMLSSSKSSKDIGVDAVLPSGVL